MNKKFMSLVACFLGVIALAACSSSSDDGSTSSSSSEESAATAIGALFASSSSANISALVKAAAEGAGERDTCDDPDGDNRGDGPQEVDVTFFALGTYGSLTDPLVVAEGESCEDENGNANTGDGPGGLGKVAAWTLNTTVTAQCGENSEDTFSMSGGSGVFRNTEDCFPFVAGTFNFVFNETTTPLDCTVCINEDQTIASSSCTDSSETAVSLEESGECQLSTE